jgi:hypothetical protein
LRASGPDFVGLRGTSPQLAHAPHMLRSRFRWNVVAVRIIAADVMSRWKTRDGEELAREALARLMVGAPLTDLRLGEHEGRIDLRGIVASKPEILRTAMRSGWAVQQLGGQAVFERVRLEGMDFSGADLQSLRFFETALVDCRFDGARCQDWRFWACDVEDTTFCRS